MFLRWWLLVCALVVPAGAAEADGRRLNIYEDAGEHSEHRRSSRSSPRGRLSFLPSACLPFVVRKFASLTAGAAAMGTKGGAWTACTHLKIYGFNFSVFLARHLAFGLKPKRVLEFGCGLGTTSDFLARFVPGGAKVTCVEPEPMLAELFGETSEGDGHDVQRRRPVQLALNSFDPTHGQCTDALFNPEMSFDLVLTLEVAEHIDPAHHEDLVRLLARATSKHLVFAAARPKQGGTGHLEGSMHPRAWWIERFQEQGLVHLPGTSEALRKSAYSERSYDLFNNIIVMARPGVTDETMLPEGLVDCAFFKRQGCSDEQLKRHVVRGHHTYDPAKDRPEMLLRHSAQIEGQVAALWPQLDYVQKQVKAGVIPC